MSSHTSLSQRDKGVLNSIFNPHLPYSDVPEEEPVIIQEEVAEVETEEIKQAKLLEMEGMRAAESNDLTAALESFNSAIAIAPNRASAYNNRAQALRLRHDVQGAKDDLNKAIELSGGKGQAACQAFVQRGLIEKLEGNDAEALEDLKKAANLGSQFARSLVIQMNPYAALCNEMLSEVIGKIQRGEQ